MNSVLGPTISSFHLASARFVDTLLDSQHTLSSPTYDRSLHAGRQSWRQDLVQHWRHDPRENRRRDQAADRAHDPVGHRVEWIPRWLEHEYLRATLRDVASGIASALEAALTPDERARIKSGMIQDTFVASTAR